MQIINFEYEKNYIMDFLNFPKKIYSKKYLTEDRKTMKQFLLNKHILSKYFKMYKYLIYDNKISARFCLIEYPNDDNIYIGFFECINDSKVAKYLFEQIQKLAKKFNKNKIIGPVDGSFFHKYRLKINNFNIPYTGEPYNKDYYFKLFKDNNYHIFEHYVSNYYQELSNDYENKLFISHYNEFINKGYKIESLKMDEFSNIIEEVYYLLTSLYAHFPIYKSITKDDFINLFMSLKQIINPNLVKLAFYKDKLVGFLICFPNYNNLVYQLNIINILKILRIKNNPKEIVAPYLGVDYNHKGLGKALVWSLALELKKNHIPCISALIHDGNINIDYAKELKTNVNEYVLLERQI